MQLSASGSQHALCMHAGRTALHYAAMHGRVGAVRELVGSGASLEVADGRGGFTALHLAADAGQCEAVGALLEAGARLEALSTKGWTPLVLATMKVPTPGPPPNGGSGPAAAEPAFSVPVWRNIGNIGQAATARSRFRQ